MGFSQPLLFYHDLTILPVTGYKEKAREQMLNSGIVLKPIDKDLFTTYLSLSWQSDGCCTVLQVMPTFFVTFGPESPARALECSA